MGSARAHAPAILSPPERMRVIYTRAHRAFGRGGDATSDSDIYRKKVTNSRTAAAFVGSAERGDSIVFPRADPLSERSSCVYSTLRTIVYVDPLDDVGTLVSLDREGVPLRARMGRSVTDGAHKNRNTADGEHFHSMTQDSARDERGD